MSLRGLSNAFTSFNTARIKFILLFLFTAAWNMILSVAQSWQIVCQKSSLNSSASPPLSSTSVKSPGRAKLTLISMVTEADTEKVQAAVPQSESAAKTHTVHHCCCCCCCMWRRAALPAWLSHRQQRWILHSGETFIKLSGDNCFHCMKNEILNDGHFAVWNSDLLWPQNKISYTAHTSGLRLIVEFKSLHAQ